MQFWGLLSVFPVTIAGLLGWIGDSLGYLILAWLAWTMRQSLRDPSRTHRQMESRASALISVSIAAIMSTAVGFVLLVEFVGTWSEAESPPPNWVQWGWYLVSLLAPPSLATMFVARRTVPELRRMIVIVGMAVAAIPWAVYLAAELLFHWF